MSSEDDDMSGTTKATKEWLHGRVPLFRGRTRNIVHK